METARTRGGRQVHAMVEGAMRHGTDMEVEASYVDTVLEEQRNGGWRYLEFLQVTRLITAGIFMREIPGGTRARQRSRPVDLPEHRYCP